MSAEAEMETTIARISMLYDAGASLPTILREVGTDDATLRIVHERLGVAMSTLRRKAAEMAREV